MNDLLDIDVDVTAFLPPDTISNGFDNVADAQTFSPTLMEGYLRAASQITALALGDRDAQPTRSELPRAEDRVADATASTARRSARAAASRSCTRSRPTATTSSAWICTATRCGLLFGAPHARTSRSKSRSTASATRCSTIDPKMSEADQNGAGAEDAADPRRRPAPQRVSAAFIQRFEGPVNDLIAPIDHTLADTQIGIALRHHHAAAPAGSEHRRPAAASPASRDTPSRRKIFICRPTSRPRKTACAARDRQAPRRRRRFAAPVTRQRFRSG